MTDSSCPLIVVIVPVLGRPGHVAPLLESFHAATDPKDARILFVAQSSDSAELEALRAAGQVPLLVEDTHRSWARKINFAYAHTQEPWMLLCADDVRFRAGWVDTVREHLEAGVARLQVEDMWEENRVLNEKIRADLEASGEVDDGGSYMAIYGSPPKPAYGVIGTNDLGNPDVIAGKTSTHPLVARWYAKYQGTMDEKNRVVHEGYRHNFPDTELALTAQKRGLWAFEPTCVIEHLHPAWGKAPDDQVYWVGRNQFEKDQALFHRRVLEFKLGEP